MFLLSICERQVVALMNFIAYKRRFHGQLTIDEPVSVFTIETHYANIS